MGDSSYEYDAFLPYLKKSVNFTPPENDLRPKNASLTYNPDAFTPGAGPLQVSFPIWSAAFSSFVKLGLNALGIETVPDFVSGALIGVQYFMNTINPQGNIRSSSQSSFLTTAMAETSLQVYNLTLAKKIIFDGKIASGVWVNTGGVDYVLSAKKEVILSAGVVRRYIWTFNSHLTPL